MEKNNKYKYSFTYEIEEWKNTGIIKAKFAAPVADMEIRIYLKDKFTERSFRETKVRESNTANPDVYEHWILK